MKKSWISAVNIYTDNNLILHYGKVIIVEKVQYEILENPAKIYNFEVEDFHTYYIVNFNVSVDNKCFEIINVTK